MDELRGPVENLSLESGIEITTNLRRRNSFASQATTLVGGRNDNDEFHHVILARVQSARDIPLGRNTSFDFVAFNPCLSPTLSYDGNRDFNDLRVSLNMPRETFPSPADVRSPSLSGLPSSVVITPIELVESVDEHITELMKIVELTDLWRQMLERDRSPDFEQCRVMHAFLEELLHLPDSGLEFTVIISSRLDKLLELLIERGSAAPDSGEQTKNLTQKAAQLERKWQKIFKGQYFVINKERGDALQGREGRLRDVFLNPFPRTLKPEWLVRSSRNRIGDFEAGHWWLNCACAYRDGIVDNVKGAFTKIALGTPTLCLFVGTETAGSQEGVTKYVHQGPISEMQLPLLSALDKKVKLLRGYRLKSLTAPRAGIRYDGFYFVRAYSHKRPNQKTDSFRVEITLERAPDQRPLENLEHIPLPSQLDDWEIYMKLREEDVKVRSLPVEYAAWRRDEFQKRKEREEWFHHQRFLASLASLK